MSSATAIVPYIKGKNANTTLPPKEEQHFNRAVVDAVRLCIGLEPLYAKDWRKRFRSYSTWSSGQLGDGNSQRIAKF